MGLINIASKRTKMLKAALRESEHLQVRGWESFSGAGTELKVLFNSGCHSVNLLEEK